MLVILGPVVTLPAETYDPFDCAVRLRRPAARGRGALLHPLGQHGTCPTRRRWRRRTGCRPLTNGDILQASTQVVAPFIDGRPLEPASKHTRLYERYRERLQEVKAGRAPLGTK